MTTTIYDDVAQAMTDLGQAAQGAASAVRDFGLRLGYDAAGRGLRALPRPWKMNQHRYGW